MIQYIRRFPATYARFCGWVYTSYGHTPSYLEFTKANLTYKLLREFFGAPAIVPPHLTTTEHFRNDAKPILEKYEHTITGGKKADPIVAVRPTDILYPLNVGMVESEEDAFWNNPANFPESSPPAPF